MTVPSTDLETKLFAAKIVAVAMLASLGVYAVVIEVLARQPLEGAAPFPPDLHDTLRTVVYGIALADGFLAAVLSRLLRPRPDSFDPASRHFSATVVALALSEAPGIFGLVLFFLTRNPAEAYPLLALSTALLLVHFPRRSRWTTP